MNPSSPTKRRALAPLNANAIASPNPRLNLKPGQQTDALGGSPTKSPLGLKRPSQAMVPSESGAAVKKQCQERQDPLSRGQAQTQAQHESHTRAASPMVRQPASEVMEEYPTGRSTMPSWEQLQQQRQYRPRSTSPDASSVFDNSITENSHDTTQDTAVTEPDVVLAATTRASTRPMTREEARQKAQILRLRLGLANYKVRTGQTDVPLERLQMRPVHDQGSTRSAVSGSTLARPEASLSSQSSQESLREGTDSAAVPRDNKEERMREKCAPGTTATATAAFTTAPSLPLGGLSPEKDAVPRSTSALNTPQRARFQNEDDEKRLTNSALRGGAANGLLSLARGA